MHVYFGTRPISGSSYSSAWHGLAELFFRLGEWSRGGPAILPRGPRRVKRNTRRVEREYSGICEDD